MLLKSWDGQTAFVSFFFSFFVFLALPPYSLTTEPTPQLRQSVETWGYVGFSVSYSCNVSQTLLIVYISGVRVFVLVAVVAFSPSALFARSTFLVPWLVSSSSRCLRFPAPDAIKHKTPSRAAIRVIDAARPLRPSQTLLLLLSGRLSSISSIVSFVSSRPLGSQQQLLTQPLL